MHAHLLRISLLGVGLLGACTDTLTPPSLTTAELQAALLEGPTRIEATISPGGDLHTLRRSTERFHDEHVRGPVEALDREAGTLTLTDVGVVSYADAGRFRTPEASRVDQAQWLDEISSALAAGDRPWIRADRPSTGAPQPGVVFHASELRLERPDDRAKIELIVGASDLDMEAGTLVVLGLHHALPADQADVLATDDDASGGDDASGDDDGAAANDQGLGDDDGTDDQGPANDDDMEDEDDHGPDHDANDDDENEDDDHGPDHG